MIPIADSEPVSIVEPQPPVAAGQGSGSQARTTTPLGTQWSARSDVGRGMWRGGMSPTGSGARTRPVKDVVVGWATAESPAEGCGAGRDRMTSVLSRSSSVSRWRPGSGPGAVMSLLRTIRPLEQATSAQGWAGHPSRSRRLLSPCSFARMPPRDRIDDATRWASRTARFTSLAPLRRRTARGSSVHRTRLWPQRRSLRRWSTAFLKPQFRTQAERPGFPTAKDHVQRRPGRVLDEPMSQLHGCATRLLNLLGPE